MVCGFSLRSWLHFRATRFGCSSASKALGRCCNSLTPVRSAVCPHEDLSWALSIPSNLFLDSGSASRSRKSRCAWTQRSGEYIGDRSKQCLRLIRIALLTSLRASSACLQVSMSTTPSPSGRSLLMPEIVQNSNEKRSSKTWRNQRRGQPKTPPTHCSHLISHAVQYVLTAQLVPEQSFYPSGQIARGQ